MMMNNNPEFNLQRECSIHTGQMIMGICMKADCQSESRLVCFSCLISDAKHTMHIKNIVGLNQIGSNVKNIGNWPQDEEGKAIKTLLQSLQKIQTHEDIENIFNTFRKHLNEQIDKIQNDVKKVYDEQYSETSKFLANLEKEFQNVYNLNRIIELFVGLNNKNLNENEFHMNINSFLVSDEKKSSMQTLRDIVKNQGSTNFLTFDQKLFDICSDKCIQSIMQFGDSFRSASSFNSIQLEIAQVKSPLTATLTVENGAVKFQQIGNSVVYTNKPLNSGLYKIKLRLDNHTQGCYVIGLEREQNKLTSNYWGQGYPACCITCKNQDAILMTTSHPGQFIGNYLGPGKIINIEVCQQKNIFNISYEDSPVSYSLSGINLKETESWRLYFNNYSGKPCQFTLLSSLYSDQV